MRGQTGTSRSPDGGRLVFWSGEGELLHAAGQRARLNRRSALH
jgi:hypothetical protein